MSNEAKNWLIDYALARRGCLLKIGAEYYIDRLSGIEDKVILEKFKKTLKRNMKLKLDTRTAIREFDSWLELLPTKKSQNITSAKTKHIISKDLSHFLSYQYSYFLDIPSLALICFTQLSKLHNQLNTNFSKILPPKCSNTKGAIAYLLKKNLDNFEAFNWLMHAIFYFEKNNKLDKVALTNKERQLLMRFRRITQDPQNYNGGTLVIPDRMADADQYCIILKLPANIRKYLKKYKKSPPLKKRDPIEDKKNDKTAIDVHTFLTANFPALLTALKKLYSKQSFHLSVTTAQTLTTIRKKKDGLIRLTEELLSLEPLEP